MKNIKNLTLIYIKQLFGSMFRIKGKSNTQKMVLGFLLLGILFAYFAFSMVTMYMGFSEMLQEGDMGTYVMLIACVYSALLLLVFMAYQIQGYFFKSKDHEILSAMPIAPYQIIVAKFVSTLLFSYFYLLLFFAPVIGVMIYLNLLSIVGMVYLFVGFFVMPMYVLLLGTLLAYLFYFLSRWLAGVKWLKTAMMFVLIIGFMGLYTIFTNSMVESILLSGQIPTYFYILLPLDSVWFLSITSQQFGWFALYLLGEGAALFLSVWLLTRAYRMVYTNKTKENLRGNGKLTYQMSRPLWTLLKQELNHYLNSTMYFFNTYFGMVLLLLFSIVGVIWFFVQPQLALLLPKEMWFTLGILAVSVFPSLSITTNVSVSLEGQMLQVKKSLPFSYQQIMLSKIGLNLLVCLPVMAVSFLLLLPIMIALSFSLLEILAILLVPVVALLTFSLFGLMVNLWFPKMEFNNETEVVKQSLSTMVSTLSSMAFVGAVATLFTAVSSVMSIHVYVALVTGVMLVLSGLLVWGIARAGRTIFNRL